MAIEFDPQEYIAALGPGNTSDPLSNMSMITDYVANNNANYGSGLQNYSNYQNNMVMTDPTFTSGLNYARSIAGGQNVPNMIAPGVSYSAANPQGFTQADLNVPAAQTVAGVPDDPAFLPGGSAVNPPDYTKLPPNVIGGGAGDNVTFLPDPRANKLRGNPTGRNIFGGGGIDYGPVELEGIERPTYQPLDLSGIQNILDSFRGNVDSPTPINIGKPVDLPGVSEFSQTPIIPNGRDFSIEQIRDDLMLPNFDDFVMKNDVPTYDDSDLRDLIAQNTTGINSVPDFDPSTLNLPDFNNFATKDDLPVFNPQDFRDDFINIAREGIDIPQFDDRALKDRIGAIENKYSTGFDELNRSIGNIPSFDPTDLYKRLDALENQPMIPNGSTFSVDQLPLGLFS